MAAAETMIVAADEIHGDRVLDRDGSALGVVDDVAIDVQRGLITHALVLCPEGPRVVPWSALARDDARGCFVLLEPA